jgi:hypothetical protein
LFDLLGYGNHHFYLFIHFAKQYYMKKVLFLFILQIPLFIRAQSSFNVIQDYGFPINHFRDVMVHHDTIYGLGIAYSDSSALAQGILLVQLDSNGTVIQKRLYVDSLERDLTIYNKSQNISRTKDGGYLFTATTIQDRDAILYKVNANLDIQFKLEFKDSILRSNFDYQALETIDGYLVHGSTQKPNYQVVGFIRHIDKSGNKTWEKEYFYTGTNNWVLSTEFINDSTIILCHNIIIDFSTFSGYSALRIIDLKTGNTLKSMDTAADAQDQFMTHVKPTPDGGFVTYGIELIGPNATFYETQSSFTKYDSDLQIEWKKHWGQRTFKQNAFFMNETYLDQDNHLVTIGRTFRDTVYDGTPNYDIRMGWVMKYTEQGDSIWSRVIPLTVPHELDNVDKNIYGGGILSSGSIVAGGMVQIGSKYYSWLIKLTTDGCLENLFSCSPNSSSTVEQVREAQQALSIVPNPAQDQVTLIADPSTPAKELVIVDALGRIHISYPISPNEVYIQLNTSTLPTGLYQVLLVGQVGVQSGRLMIQRN